MLKTKKHTITNHTVLKFMFEHEPDIKQVMAYFTTLPIDERIVWNDGRFIKLAEDIRIKVI